MLKTKSKHIDFGLTKTGSRLSIENVDLERDREGILRILGLWLDKERLYESTRRRIQTLIDILTKDQIIS